MRIHHFSYDNDRRIYDLTGVFDDSGKFVQLKGPDCDNLGDHDYTCAVQKAEDINFTWEQERQK